MGQMQKDIDISETHVHSWDRRIGAAAVPSGETHVADLLGTSVAGFVLTSGSPGWGAWTQILGSADTGGATPNCGEANKAYFDLHNIGFEANNSNSTYYIQVACGESTDLAAKVTARTYSAKIFFGANSAKPTLDNMNFERQPAGTKVWARIYCLGGNSKTLTCWFGFHEYDADTTGNVDTFDLKQLNIINNSGDAIYASSTGGNGKGISVNGNGTGAGIYIEGGASASGSLHIYRSSGDAIYVRSGGSGKAINLLAQGDDAIYIQSDTGNCIHLVSVASDTIYVVSAAGNGSGINILGHGSGNGIVVSGGATGNGIKAVGGATSGDAINASSANGHGAKLSGAGTSNYGLYAISANSIGAQIQGYAEALKIISSTNHAVRAEAGANGNGISVLGGSVSGDAVNVSAQGGSGNGIAITGAGTGKGISAAETDSIIARIGAFTGSGWNTILGFLRALMRKDGGVTIPSDIGGTFNNTTDSTEAIADAAGGSLAADIALIKGQTEKMGFDDTGNSINDPVPNVITGDGTHQTNFLVFDTVYLGVGTIVVRWKQYDDHAVLLCDITDTWYIAANGTMNKVTSVVNYGSPIGTPNFTSVYGTLRFDWQVYNGYETIFSVNGNLVTSNIKADTQNTVDANLTKMQGDTQPVTSLNAAIDRMNNVVNTNVRSIESQPVVDIQSGLALETSLDEIKGSGFVTDTDSLTDLAHSATEKANFQRVVDILDKTEYNNII